MRGIQRKGRHVSLIVQWATILWFTPVALHVGTAHAANIATRIDAFVEMEMQREKVPGAAIAVIRKGDVLVAKGYGLANVELRVPVSVDTIFQSGSVGKQFTAAALMLMVEGGKVSLDDPIVKYFTDAPPNWRDIRVRHLLTHTSGIPNFGRADIDWKRNYSEDELLKIAERLPLEFQPGSRWRYSNTGYELLGFLIHKVSGKFYGDILRDRIFAPLGMKTARIISEEDIVPNRAAGYRLVGGEIKNQEWVAPSANSTAEGSLYLSMRDFMAWENGLRAGAVLSPQSWLQVYTPVRLNSGKTYPYGFGWMVGEIAGQRWLHHSGSWQGFKTDISRYIGDDLAVLVLTNSANANPDRFADGIAALLNPALAKHELDMPRPMPDKDPGVRQRLSLLLSKASDGHLSLVDLPYAPYEFFPSSAKRYQEMLQPLGPPQRIDLVQYQELGDDRIYTYAARYENRTLIVQLGLDGTETSEFQIRQAPASPAPPM